jgi:hypothetical protein
MAAAVSLGVASSWFQPSVAGSDLWWHLASGRMIWETRSIPRVDPFSYTFAGQPWTNHEWLWDVVYWGLYQLHPEAVAWFNLALLFLVFALVYQIARRASGSGLAAGAAIALAAACSHWFLDIRPHLFTLLLVSVLLRTRGQPLALWLWPLLVVVWTNLHGGFAFGVGVIGLWTLHQTVEQSWPARALRLPGRTWATLGLCLVAVLANPWGWHVLDYPRAYLDADSPFRSIVEWQPPGFGLDPRTFQGRFWLGVALWLPGLGLALRRDRFLAALSLVGFAMAFTSRRFIPLYALVASPVVALGLAQAQTWLLQRVRGLATPRAAAVATALGLLLAVWLWRDVRLVPRLLDRWTEHWFYPQAALRYLQILDPPGRLLNFYNWGGYMFLHAPGRRAFIDGRANTLYDERIYNHYVALMGASPGFRALLARYRIDYLLMPVSAPLVTALQRPPDAWITVYQDRTAAILVAPGSPLLQRPAPRLELALGGHPDLEIAAADELARRGQLDLAAAKLEAVIAKDPLIPGAYGSLAIAHGRRGDLGRAAEAIERGIRALPREERRLREFESRAYLAAGALDRAIAALEKSVPNGPFSNPAQILERITRLKAGRDLRPAAAPGDPG